jgi:hypothetical protein
MLVQRIKRDFPKTQIIESTTLEELKNILADLYEQQKFNKITTQIAEIKDYRNYEDIQNTFKQIVNNMLL